MTARHVSSLRAQRRLSLLAYHLSSVVLLLGCTGANDLDSLTATEDEPSSAAAPLTDFGGHTIAVYGLADPDLMVDGDRALLTGTGGHPLVTAKIYELHGTQFDLVHQYDPNALEAAVRATPQNPAYHYCQIMGEDLERVGDEYILSLTALRVPRGQSCVYSDDPAVRRPSNGSLSIYFTRAPAGSFRFGRLEAVQFGADPATPRSMARTGCPRGGCERAMRIDSSVFHDNDGSTHVSYVWWRSPWNSNNIATFNVNDPRNVMQLASPGRGDERVNEAPSIFRRGNRYYLVYSAGHFRGNYRLRYTSATSVAGLSTRQTRAQDLPVRGAERYRYGGGSVAWYNGTAYIAYHVNDPNSYARHTAIGRLIFQPDGRMSIEPAR